MATDTQDLHTGKPVWLASGLPHVPVQSLTKNIRTDIVIMGAGITGAMAAQALSAEGFNVVLVDKRGPMMGATLATTALLQYEIDQPLIKLRRQIGDERAQRAWQRSKLGLESLASTLQALNIRCGYKRCSSLYLAGTLLDGAALKEEEKARAHMGLPNRYLTRSALSERYGIHRQAALLTENNLTVQPLAMTAGFLRQAILQGAHIYAPLQVTHVESNARNVHVHTSYGHCITARYAVYATGYEMPKEIRTCKHSIHSTYAIATKPQPHALWPTRAMIWEASDPYLYMRTTSDGRVICGGGDEDFEDDDKRDALIAKKQQLLERKLAKLFPKLDTRAEFAWAGSFGSSTTGLPTIGEIPGMKRCYAIMAYGGNGITFSRIAAEIITAELTGHADIDADLFAFA